LRNHVALKSIGQRKRDQSPKKQTSGAANQKPVAANPVPIIGPFGKPPPTPTMAEL
jgi:hypothetical protein